MDPQTSGSLDQRKTHVGVVTIRKEYLCTATHVDSNKLVITRLSNLLDCSCPLSCRIPFTCYPQTKAALITIPYTLLIVRDKPLALHQSLLSVESLNTSKPTVYCHLVCTCSSSSKKGVEAFSGRVVVIVSKSLSTSQVQASGS